MSVLCEAFSVIVKRESIEQFYSGGWDSFIKDIPNQTMCADEMIVRVGFFSPSEVESYIIALESKGLNYLKHERESDIAVVDQNDGIILTCDWLQFGKFKLDGHDCDISTCWIIDKENINIKGMNFKELKNNLATPHGWSPESYKQIKFKDS